MSEKGDNLESLSNAELHLKCLENGMNNIPVTDQSRSVLIKRLRAILSGSLADTPSKPNKRYSEVPKVADKIAEDKSTKRSNRRTIAVTKPIGSDETVDSVENIAATVTTKKREGSIQKVPVTIIDDIDIESDDDVDLVNAAVQAEAESNMPVRGRTTRSLSVSKSSIPVPVPAAKKDIDTIIEEPEVESVVRKRSTRSVSLSKSSVVTVSFDGNVIPIEEELPVSSAQVTHQHTDVYVKSEKKSAEQFKQPTKKAEQRPYIPAVFDKHSQPVTTTTGYSFVDTSKYASPSRLSTAAGTPTLLVGKTSAYYNEHSDDTDTEPYDTPYLSNFARSLDRLKTDPHISRISTGKYGSSSTEMITPRKSIVKNSHKHPPIWKQLTNLFWAVEHKYHICRNLFFIIVALAVIYFIIYFWR